MQKIIWICLLSFSLFCGISHATVTFETSTPNHYVFEEGVQAEITFTFNGLHSNRTYDLDYEIRDYWGSTLTAVEGISLSTNVLNINPPQTEQGWYKVIIKLRENGAESYANNTQIAGYTPFAAFAIVTPFARPADSPFGLCEHDADDGMADLFDLLGVTWLRSDVWWGLPGVGVQRVDANTWDWARVDRIINIPNTHGFHTLPIINYGTRWASTGPPDANNWNIRMYIPQQQPWETFVETLVNRYRDKVTHWEVWNEANLNIFWKNTQTDYDTLLTWTYGKVKQADPDAFVFHAGTSGPGLDWIDAVQGPYDGHAMHPYYNLNDPEETLPPVLQDARVSTKPLWITETGVNTAGSYIKAATLEEQAHLLVRGIVTALSYGVEKFMWFEFQNYRLNADDRESNWGIMFKDRTPKPSYLAYANLIRRVGTKNVQPMQKLSATAYRVNFKGEDKLLSVIWSTEDSEVVDVPVSGADIAFYDIMGDKGNMIPTNGKIQLAISKTPVYLEYEPTECVCN